MSSARFHRLLLAAGLAVWFGNALLLLLAPGPLGHDEAQYALDAMDQLAGQPSRWIYLSRGMRALSTPGIWLGGSETALRFAPFVVATAFIVVAWRLARRVAGPEVAAWTIAVLAGSRSVMKMSVDLLSDLPSTTCMLAAILLIAAELDRDRDDRGPRWRLVLVGPLLAGAFYLRYGSIVPIALIVVGALAFGAKRLARRPWPALVAAALFALCMVPHLLESKAKLGSMLGLLLESKQVPSGNTTYFGQGLVTYVTKNPFYYYGLPTGLAMIAALGALWPRRPRGVVFVAVLGVADIVALGLTTHAQARYVFLGIALLVIAGTHVLYTLATTRLARPQLAAMVATVYAVVAWVIVTNGMLRYRHRPGLRATEVTEAARVIRADTGERRCHVLGAAETQLEYYSGCSTQPFSPPEALAKGERIYIVRDGLPGYQPEELPGRYQPLVQRPEFTIRRYDGP